MALERYVKAFANFERMYPIEIQRARKINDRQGFPDEPYRIELQNYYQDTDVARTADFLWKVFGTPENASQALAAVGISVYATGSIATALAISRIDERSLENILNRMASRKISRRGLIGTAVLPLVIAAEACGDNTSTFAPDPVDPNPRSSEPAYLDNIVNSARELLLGTYIPDKRPVLPNGVLKVYQFSEQMAGTDSTPIAEIPIVDGSYKITKDHKLLLPNHNTVSLLIETSEGITRYIHRASLTEAGFTFNGMPLDVIANDGLTGYRYADYQNAAHWWFPDRMSVRWLNPATIFLYDVTAWKAHSSGTGGLLEPIPNYPFDDYQRTTNDRMIDVARNDPQLYTAGFIPGNITLESRERANGKTDFPRPDDREATGIIFVIHRIDNAPGLGIGVSLRVSDHEIVQGYAGIDTGLIKGPPSRYALSQELNEMLGYNYRNLNVIRLERDGKGVWRPNKFSSQYVGPILYNRNKGHNSSNAPDSDYVAPGTRSAPGPETYTKSINGITTSFTIDSR